MTVGVFVRKCARVRVCMCVSDCMCVRTWVRVYVSLVGART